MTSVLSPLRQLNGNKIAWIGFIFAALLLFSCGGLKKADGPKTDRGELGEIRGKKRYKTPRNSSKPRAKTDGTLDTIIWSSRPDAYPPIKSPPKKVVVQPKKEPDPIPKNTRPDVPEPEPRGEVKYGTYNVSILMPFLTNRVGANPTEITGTSAKALQFYTGAKLALYHLEDEDVNLNVSVFDSKGSAAEVKNILNRSELQNAHMIIGPRSKSVLKEVAKFAKEKKKVLVSPWNPSTGITDDNPYYIQVSPYLNTHLEAIMRDAKSRFRSSQIRLLCRNGGNEASRFKALQDANYIVEGSTNAERLREMIITEGSDDVDLADVFVEGDTTVFIIPSWSEGFVGDILRRIFIARQRNPVVVYGMPQWMRFDKISYDYFEKLNVHISSATFVDNESDKIKRFASDFYTLYGTLPTKDAFIGYDVTLYFGRTIAKNGAYFQYKLERDNRLHTNFDFQQTYAPNDDSFSRVLQIENRFVNILRFKDYKFHRVNK